MAPITPTYIGYCCREWVLAYGYRGSCGYCDNVPTLIRHDQPPVVEDES